MSAWVKHGAKCVFIGYLPGIQIEEPGTENVSDPSEGQIYTINWIGMLDHQFCIGLAELDPRAAWDVRCFRPLAYPSQSLEHDVAQFRKISRQLPAPATASPSIVTRDMNRAARGKRVGDARPMSLTTVRIGAMWLWWIKANLPGFGPMFSTPILPVELGRAFGSGPFPNSVCAGRSPSTSPAQGDRSFVPAFGRSPPISVGLTPLIGLRVVSRFPSASSRWITSAAIDPIRRNTINQSLRFLVTTKKYVATSETEILEKSAKNTSEKMSASAQMMLRDYAGRRWPAMNHKGRITRLSRLLQWGHRRVRAIYNNESGGRLRAEEMAAIEALRGEARSEYRTIEALAAGLEALLTQTDEDCYRAQIDALRQIYRGVDRPGDQVK